MAPQDNVATAEESATDPIIETEFFAYGTSTVRVTADFSVNTDTLIVRWCEGQDLVSLASIL